MEGIEVGCTVGRPDGTPVGAYDVGALDGSPLGSPLG